MQLSTLAKRGSLILFFVVAAFYLYGLGHLPLLGPDEPRYAQIAREMFLRRDLITPTLGGHPWFEKPALLYWMMMASYKLFGVSEWSARLPAAVSGLLTVGAVFFVARSVERLDAPINGGRATFDQSGTDRNVSPMAPGFWSALAAATTLGIVIFARAASFDIIVTMTLTWTLAFFLVSELRAHVQARRKLLVGFYVFVGLSLLAKGLIGIVIPAGVIGIYSLFRRRLPEPKIWRSLLWGVPLTLAVASLWYAPVIWRNGWPFVDQFFIQHQFARYVSNKYRHPAPTYFYVLILIPLALPWTAFILDEIRRMKPWRRTQDSPQDRLLSFALAWLLFPLLFFSFSTSKLPGYILPVLPAMALLAGHNLKQVAADTRSRTLRIMAALILVLAIATPIVAFRMGQPLLMCAGIVAVFLALAGVLPLISRARAQSTSLLVIAAATLGVVLSVLHCWAPQSAERETSKHLLLLADQRGYSQTAIYGLQRDDRSPEFYAGGRVVYGPDKEPIMFEDAAPVVAESRARNEALLVFVQAKDLGYLTGLKWARIEVIGDNGKVALIAMSGK